MKNEELVCFIGAGRQDCFDMHSFGPGMRNCYIIHYIIKGSGTFVVNNTKYKINEGESFIIAPYTTVWYFPDKRTPWEYTWIEFSGEYVNQILSNMSISINNPIFPYIEKKYILKYFERAVNGNLLQEKKNEAAGIVYTILGCIGDVLSQIGNNLSENDIRLSNAITYIHTNYYCQNFKVEKLCCMLNLSRTTLYRLFKEDIGMSPMEYLKKYRIEQAKKMLLKKASVKSTALSCGFTDPLYFSKQFTQVVGVCPSKYNT
ncbi:MAG: AraC family transcriptional regulator [Clostridium sp.]|nr:AraC family transcriptional regulator [Clostridium sp.]